MPVQLCRSNFKLRQRFIGMAEEENNEEEKKGSKKMIIMIALAVVALAIGAGGAFFFMGSEEPPAEEMAENMEEQAEMEKEMSVYHELHPAFVANFSGKSNKSYMQVYIVAMAREDAVIEDMKMHMPAIRNDVLMTLSATTSQEIETVEGKEALRQKVLSKIKQTMEMKTGRAGVEDIYFTKFVAQ